MKNLEYKARNCWERYASPEEREQIQTLAESYRSFLSQCKTERETIHFVAEELKKQGWKEGITNDTALFTLHNKALIAVRKGKRKLSDGMRLLAAHVDSPRLDLKQHPLLEQCSVGQAKTHYYGGIRKYQWLARPLAIHGVVVLESGETIHIVLGEEEHEAVFTIADLLPHLAQSQADKPLSKVFEGEKLNIVMGHEPLLDEKGEAGEGAIKRHILSLLKEKYNFVEEDLYSAELQIVPAGPARFVGLDKSIIGGYGQDDRISVFTCLQAFIQQTEQSEYAQCILFYDKEEIGSEGATGAKSRFFEYCITELLDEWEEGKKFARTMLHTKAISADVHGALDPDWQELHEKLNSAYLGFGPCMCKFTGHRGKYEANDAHPEYVAWLRSIFNQANIPWQMAELGKIDEGGGGTVAMYLAAYGMNIIDCGPAILAMHSPFELASIADIYATSLAFSTFLRA